MKSDSAMIVTARMRTAPAMGGRVLEGFARALLIYASLMACFGVPVLAVRSLVSPSNQLPWIAGAITSVTIPVILWTCRYTLRRWFSDLAASAARVPESSWIALCLSAGIVLRLAWIAAFPGTPASDGATYVDLARKLIVGEPYLANGTHAYWPPGYPFYLTPWLAVIPNAHLAIVVSNLFLFLVGALGVWKLGGLATGPGYARIALLLFALWPNLAFQTGIPEKEQALVALLPWILALSFVPKSSMPPFWKTFLAGLLLGAATLVQPILQLFPAVLLCYWLLCCRRVLVPVRMTMLTVLAMMIVIGPWTFRNSSRVRPLRVYIYQRGFELIRRQQPNGYWALSRTLAR